MAPSTKNNHALIIAIIGIVFAVMLVIAIGLTVFVWPLFTTFSGSASTANTNAAVEYVHETYPDLNVEVRDSHYSYKGGITIVLFQSPTSEDTAFEVTVSAEGEIKNDDYESKVLQKYSTFGRLNQEASRLIEDVITKELPYNFTFVRGSFGYQDQPVVTATLQLDMPLDRKHPPFPYQASITMTDTDVSYTKVEEVMRAVRTLFDEQDLPLASISVTIEPPSDDGGPGESLTAFNIPVEVLDQPDALAQIEQLSR